MGRLIAYVDQCRSSAYAGHMKTIGVRQLRQNPSQMIQDVKNGEPYSLTERGNEIGVIVPSAAPLVAPPRRSHGAHTRVTARRALAAAGSVDQHVDEMKGEW